MLNKIKKTILTISILIFYTLVYTAHKFYCTTEVCPFIYYHNNFMCNK